MKVSAVETFNDIRSAALLGLELVWATTSFTFVGGLNDAATDVAVGGGIGLGTLVAVWSDGCREDNSFSLCSF